MDELEEKLKQKYIDDKNYNLTFAQFCYVEGVRNKALAIDKECNNCEDQWWNALYRTEINAVDRVFKYIYHDDADKYKQEYYNYINRDKE